MGCRGRAARLRAVVAAWPALAFYLGAWPAGLAGEWTAVWLFFLSGTVLAVTLSRARYIRAAVCVLPQTSDAPEEPASSR